MTFCLSNNEFFLVGKLPESTLIIREIHTLLKAWRLAHVRSFVSRFSYTARRICQSVYIARASYWHARSCGRVPIIIESNYISAGRQNWQNNRGRIVTLSRDIQSDLSLSFLSHGVCQCSRVEDGSGVRVVERCDENVLLAYLRLWEKRAVPRKTCRNSIQFYVCVCAWENPFSLCVSRILPCSHSLLSTLPIGLSVY